MDNIRIPIEELEKALLDTDRIRAAEIYEKYYLKNKNFEALEHLTMEALEKIGDGWEEGKFSLAQVYMSGIICEELIKKYQPNFEKSHKKQPKIAIAVLQDHHALGKRIVYSVVKSSGYDLIDFGQGLSVEDIVERTIEEKIEVLLISTLMLPSALKVKEVVESLREKKSSAIVIVGGAPFRLDDSLWQKVNAYADGKNGAKASKIIERLTEGGIRE